MSYSVEYELINLLNDDPKIEKSNYSIENILKVLDFSIKQGVYRLVIKKMNDLNLINGLDNKTKAIIKMQSINLNYYHNLYVIELKHLAKHFGEANIKVVLLKGESLNELIYNGYRDYTDLDFLISDNQFENFIDIMLKNGYKLFYNNNYISFNEAKKIFNISCERCFELVKETENKTFYIDIHKEVSNSSEALDYIYKQAEKSNLYEGIYIPNIYCAFIYACFHFWHHYPNSTRLTIAGSLTTVKSVLDIKELFSKISGCYSIDKLNKIIHFLDVKYLVEEMLYISERTFGKFTNNYIKNDYIPSLINDFKDGNYETLIQDRIIDPVNEISKYINYQNSKNVKQHLPLILCNYTNKEVSEIFNSDFFKGSDEYHIKENQFWHPEFGYKIIEYYNQKANYTLCWNETYLFIKLSVQNVKKKFSSKNTYDENSDLVLVCFNDNWNEKISIQPKNNGEHKIYYDSINLLDKYEINDCFLSINDFESGYDLIAAIPWHYINIKPSINKVIDFYILIHTGNIRHLGIHALASTDMERKLCFVKKNI